jgi:hypothetical protein
LLADLAALGLLVFWLGARAAVHEDARILWAAAGGLAATTVFGLATVGPGALLAAAAVGSAAAIRQRSTDRPPRWLLVAWAGTVLLVIYGILGSEGVLSAWVLLLATLVAAVSVTLATPTVRAALAAFAIAFSGALGNFVFLFKLAKDAGIEVVAVPEGALALTTVDRTDYADAYSVRLPSATSFDLETVTIGWVAAASPCWARADRSPAQTLKELRPPPIMLASNEIVIGADEDHLNFRVSVMLSEHGGEQWATASTIVQFNNWRGVAYFVPVRIGHQVLLPQIMRNLAPRLHEMSASRP